MSNSLASLSGSALDIVPVRRALLSVSDKTHLIELASILIQYNVQILSTGGTANAIKAAGLPVTDVSDYTQSSEILDGRVKTLHPKIHGGLLAVRGNEKHESEMIANGVLPIDLVVMNLYPFEATVALGADMATCVENIDIGGPSMLRSAAKNHAYVAVLTSPSQYETFLNEFKANDGATTLKLRRKLALSAFQDSSAYDTAIATYLSKEIEDPLPAPTQTVCKAYIPEITLKYGCNPHQKPAVIYKQIGSSLPFKVINGTPGYINLLDACNAWQLVLELTQALELPAAASFKHCSPAGAAVGIPLTRKEATAYEITDPLLLSPTALSYVRARNADPMCSFGDFAAVSAIIDISTAKILQTAVCDGIIAPGFEPEAYEILKAKKGGNFIILQGNPDYTPPAVEFREMYGVTFSQKRNDVIFDRSYLKKIVTKTTATTGSTVFSEEAIRDLILASITIKYTQSNSVGYAINGQMIGVGAGQQSRVDCVKLAGRKAAVWWLRQMEKVLNLPFVSHVKRQERINARVRYIEGDFTPVEYQNWSKLFITVPEDLSDAERQQHMATLSDVSISSDAFFPFRDSIDVCSKYGVRYVVQPGGSVADNEVIAACEEYGMVMTFSDLRLFHH